MKEVKNVSQQEIDEAMDSLYDWEDKNRKKLLSAFKYALKNIDYPSERIKEYLREGDNWHIGYCTVEEDINYKSHHYPGYKFYNVIGDKVEEKTIPRHLMRQDDSTDDNFHCLVWQTCQCEDCYSGYILFPLTDGRYWVTSFEC